MAKWYGRRWITAQGIIFCDMCHEVAMEKKKQREAIEADIRAVDVEEANEESKLSRDAYSR